MNKLNKTALLLAVCWSAVLAAGCSLETGVSVTSKDKASTDLGHSRYVQEFTDQKTGCEYLTTMDGGITPRLNAAGNQVGCSS